MVKAHLGVIILSVCMVLGKAYHCGVEAMSFQGLPTASKMNITFSDVNKLINGVRF